ncbi:MAG: hypothetical protein GY853_10075 [PVC group bacterium]|nr:hypothetical protein [PVC group bacterium]
MRKIGFSTEDIAKRIREDKRKKNKQMQTDKGPCAYCRDNFIKHEDHAFCGHCGMALNR